MAARSMLDLTWTGRTRRVWASGYAACRGQLADGQPMTAPDNDHLHNRVHGYFKSVFKSKNMANSATGLSIAAGSSGIALAGYVGELIPISSNLWFFVFLAQCGLYGLIFISAGKPSDNPQ